MLPGPAEAFARLAATPAAEGALFDRRSLSCLPDDPLDWLQAQPAGDRFYWQGRDGEVTVGAGVAHLVAGRASECAASFLQLYMRAGRQAAGQIRYFGGLSFDRDAVDGIWAPFDRCRFQLPARSLVCRTDGTAEAIAISAPGLHNPAAAACPRPAAPVAGPCPDQSGWRQQTEAALVAIAAGTLRKVVLAGRTTVRLGRAVDAFAILRRLRTTRDAFVFAFEPAPGVVFLGASPERLYRREGQAIKTEAIAGTRPRGSSPEQDAALAAELLASDKDRREQQFVLAELVASLQPLCMELKTMEDAPTVMQLSHVQHLVQHLQGTLRDSVLDHELLRAIHPTPAVGGLPRLAAEDFRHQVESFPRGWYASPVGWLSPAASEFAVAIRSGLIINDTVTAFGGAGIVAGSVPEREWDEIQIKQAALLRLAAESAP